MTDATPPLTIGTGGPERQTRAPIGEGVDRVDGPLKVSGEARYAYEYAGAGEAVYGFIVGSAIANGTILSIDGLHAEAAPGVLLVLTYKNMPKQAKFVSSDVPMPGVRMRYSRPRPFLTGPEVRYHGQPIALVVAGTFEQARAAAAFVAAQYAETKPLAELRAADGAAYRPKVLNGGYAPDSEQGDFEKAFAAAPVKVDLVYSTPSQNHNAMEPHATTASWRNNFLTLFTSAQLPNSTRDAVARTFELPIEQVRIISKFVGGGFGGKGSTEADAILAAHAARLLRRPVKVAMTRQQLFMNVEHRPATIQHIRLAATRTGDLVATAHDVIEESAVYEEFAEQTAVCSRNLYAAPNRRTSHRLVRLNRHSPGTMRAPGEATGLLAYEAAVDELAGKLGIDPVELRVRNEPKTDPESGKPFSTRNLVSCLRQGAKRFGWNDRQARPASRREEDWLIGLGAASAFRPNFLVPGNAEVRIDGNGTVNVATAMTDIGTGTYTILTQIAAETLDVPRAQVTVEIGDSSLPPSLGSAGSAGAASSGSAVLDACTKLRAKLALLIGSADAGLRIQGGNVFTGARGVALADILGPVGTLVAEGSVMPGAEQGAFNHAAYGAHFAEVAVDAVTGEIRVRRMLGVFAAGRILNEKTARSQLLGGMIWGLSAALYERTEVDPRSAVPINHDLAEYHVPVHADVPQMEVEFLAEPNDVANPLGIKGIGELGICGSGAAINNAVFNATGVRVRDYPIRLDKLIERLPPLESAA